MQNLNIIPDALIEQYVVPMGLEYREGVLFIASVRVIVDEKA